MIKTVEELQREINELKDREEINCRERTILTKNINATRKQIEKLEEMVLDSNQYELYGED